MSNKSLSLKLLFHARNLRSRALFRALQKYCRGQVLDVGGWDFYIMVKKRGIKFSHWITLDKTSDCKPDIDDQNFEFVIGDGCRMNFRDNQFDTVLNIQVLEHVFEPIKMVQEISRVLKPNGYGIFLIPQTAMLHLAPEHHHNFTSYWIRQVMKKSGLEIVELHPLGGFWSTIASRLIYFFFQSTRFQGMSSKDNKRNVIFYILYPLMVAYAVISIPICLLLSLGDLTEEPNNNLVVVKKI